MSIIEQMKFELKYLEYIVYTNPKVNEKFYVVIEFTTYTDKTKPYLIVRNIQTGDEIKTKVTSGKSFSENPFNKFSVLKIDEFKDNFKKKMINGDWVKTDEVEQIFKRLDGD